MAIQFVFMMCPVGIGVALLRRYARAGAAGPAARDDVPELLLRWAAGLLSAQRAEWGQAMLGELDHIDGRSRRWRFAVGCAGAVLLLPPWGRAAAAVWAMRGRGRCHRPAPPWSSGTGCVGGCVGAIILVFLVSTPPRRERAAVPPRCRRTRTAGRPCVILAWLAIQRFTFAGVIVPMIAPLRGWR
jgi:hypothetical protein